MKWDRITHGSAMPLAYVGVSCQMLFTALIDLPGMGNAVWISVLLSFVFCLPLLALIRVSMSRAAAPRTLYAPIALIYVYDAAVMLTMLTDSAAYALLYNLPESMLYLPAVVVAFLVCAKGGNALGDATRLWLVPLALLFVIILTMQVSLMKPEWLMPILGPGARTLLTGARKIAGAQSLILGAYILIEPRPNADAKKMARSPFLLALICTGTVALLCLFRSMLLPTIFKANDSRAFRLDQLLSNGRTTLSLQLPIIIASYTSLFVGFLFELYVAVSLIMRLFPNAQKSRWVILFICCAAVFTISVAGFANQMRALTFGNWLFAVMTAFACLLCLLSRKRGANE